MQLLSPLRDIFRLNETQKRALSRANLETIVDLLFYFPSRYSNPSEIKQIRDVKIGENVTLSGKISKLRTRKAWKRKIPMGEGYLEDLSGKIKIIWFNQAYLAKMTQEGQTVQLTGKITGGGNGVYLANPELEKNVEQSIWNSSANNQLGYPLYPEKRGLTSRWIYHSIKKILVNNLVKEIKDYLPKEMLKKYNLPSLKTALIWIHSPQNKNDALSARKRFAFEEVFFIQLKRQHDRLEYKKNKSFAIDSVEKDIKNFISRFDFELTKSQQKAIDYILNDIKKSHPMSRLLEGDVGSGKTAVAASISYAVIRNHPLKQDFGNLQVAYMAPTEVLANQLYESFIQYFKHLNINIGLITSSGCKKFPSKVKPGGWTNIPRAQLLKWVANGEIPILIGTHSLIQKTVKFKNLALVIIDEQHRFGTAQRRKLARKDGVAPHLLSMTATPIPRTLALTI